MARAPRNGGRAPAASKPRGKKAEAKAAADAAAQVAKNAAATAATIISPDAFKKKMKALANARTAAREASGDASAIASKLCTPKSDGGSGCDKRAVGILEKLNKMPDNQLQTTLPFLLWGIDALGLGERASSQGQLAMDPKADEGDAADTGGDEDDAPAPGARTPLSIVPKAMDAAEPAAANG